MGRMLAIAIVVLLVAPAYAQEIEVTVMPDREVATVYTVVDYAVCVLNNTNGDLRLISIYDTLLGDLTASYPLYLFAGETQCESFLYMVEPDDPDPLVNTVTAEYSDETRPTYVDSDSAEVDIVHPDFTVTVTCASDTLEPGGLAEFEILIENTGDVPLIFETDEPEIPVFTLSPGEVLWATVLRFVPPGADEVCYEIQVRATIPPEYSLEDVYIQIAEGCCPPTGSGVEENTWGRIKGLYR